MHCNLNYVLLEFWVATRKSWLDANICIEVNIDAVKSDNTVQHCQHRFRDLIEVWLICQYWSDYNI